MKPVYNLYGVRIPGMFEGGESVAGTVINSTDEQCVPGPGTKCHGPRRGRHGKYRSRRDHKRSKKKYWQKRGY